MSLLEFTMKNMKMKLPSEYLCTVLSGNTPIFFSKTIDGPKFFYGKVLNTSIVMSKTYQKPFRQFLATPGRFSIFFSSRKVFFLCNRTLLRQKLSCVWLRRFWIIAPRNKNWRIPTKRIAPPCMNYCTDFFCFSCSRIHISTC